MPCDEGRRAESQVIRASAVDQEGDHRRCPRGFSGDRPSQPMDRVPCIADPLDVVLPTLGFVVRSREGSGNLHTEEPAVREFCASIDSWVVFGTNDGRFAGGYAEVAAQDCYERLACRQRVHSPTPPDNRCARTSIEDNRP